MSDEHDDLLAALSEVTDRNHARIAKVLLLLDIPIKIEVPEDAQDSAAIDALLNARQLIRELPTHPVHEGVLNTVILDFLGGLTLTNTAFDNPGDAEWLLRAALLSMYRVSEQVSIAYGLLTGQISTEELDGLQD
ncbi:hypothetical protein [Nocardia iowensis]|uniref:Uncharacterized protein n=1 Tax=Nocardia iowensis TaxID=204891 RepID=A0ABX8RQP9_NOCIO|nr:hypothetical protein [Nocardia iowensis]QXN91957.1 hypothetical protein KV110_01830 [Nocardia iowensis]